MLYIHAGMTFSRPKTMSAHSGCGQRQPTALLATTRVAERLALLLSDSPRQPSRIDVFDCPATALNQLTQCRYNIGLVDISIGESRALQIIQSLGGRTSGTPLILLVNRYSEGIANAALEAGAYDCIDRRDLPGPIFSRALRYTHACHALELRLAQCEHELRVSAQLAREMRAIGNSKSDTQHQRAFE